MQVTARACDDLREIYTELQNEDDDAVLSDEQADRLSQVMGDIRRTLEAELRGLLVYTVLPKRLDVTRLLSDVSFLFSPNTYEKLPEIARYDLAEGGKCIAFERPTAAAFHLMRATEAVLRAFSAVHLVTSNDNLWGPMIKELRAKLTDSDHLALLNNLDNTRVSFRNPTQHPQKIYDIQEVQDLWGLCVDAINRIAKDLPSVAT